MSSWLDHILVWLTTLWLLFANADDCRSSLFHKLDSNVVFKMTFSSRHLYTEETNGHIWILKKVAGGWNEWTNQTSSRFQTMQWKYVFARSKGPLFVSTICLSALLFSLRKSESRRMPTNDYAPWIWRVWRVFIFVKRWGCVCFSHPLHDIDQLPFYLLKFHCHDRWGSVFGKSPSPTMKFVLHDVWWVVDDWKQTECGFLDSWKWNECS